MPRYDMVVIGSGPSGQRAAIQAAKLGGRVAVCERREVVGGICVDIGTIPSKTFREGALYLTGFMQRGIYGPAYTLKEDVTMADLVFRCQQVTGREAGIVRQQLRRNHVEVITGSASFLDGHSLKVVGPAGETAFEADYIVIACGTEAIRPDNVHIDSDWVFTPDDILQMKDLPRSLTVVGGGVVGIEYASIFAELGVEVTVVDRSVRLLQFADAEIVDALIYRMRDMNCVFRLGEKVATVEIHGPERVVATLESGKKIISDALLYSVGRVGATDGLNLPNAGLEEDGRGRLPVNDSYQTNQSHIYAVGDVIGFPALASTSAEQGRVAACNAFGVKHTSLPQLFPYGIYSVPEISMVGQTEQALTEARVPYEIGVARFREIARGAIIGTTDGMLKLLFHQETRKLLGVHIVGHGASELVHIGQAVLAFDGTVDYFVNSVFNYPTFAECYKVAALDGYNKVGPPVGAPPPPDLL